MAINKEKKESIISKLKDITKSDSVVFASFSGIPVSLVTEMRQTLRDKGIGYFVAKKTLIRKSFSDSKVEGDIPELPGEIAVVYGEDPLATTKGIYEFQKNHKDSISIVGGVYEGAYAESSYLVALAQVPGRDVLYGQFAHLLNWPVQSLAMTLKQVADKKGE